MSLSSSVSKETKTEWTSLLGGGRAKVRSLYQRAKRITPDGRLVILARALRTFGYGFTSVLLGVMLTNAGVSTVRIGLLLGVAALGSITFSIVMGMYADRIGRKRSLVVSALLMMGTGYVFAFTQWYPLLLIAAFCGTISPSTNDNTPFSGIEQAILAQTSRAKHPTALFALYNLAAQFAGAIGGLAVGLLEVLSHAGIAAPVGMRYLFLLYGLLAGSTGLLFLRLSPAAELQTPKEKTSSGSSGTGTSMQEGTSTQEVTSTQKPCRVPQQRKIRGIILKLSSLFALDAFAGGLAVQTILAIWFRLRFGVFNSAAGESRRKSNPVLPASKPYRMKR